MFVWTADAFLCFGVLVVLFPANSYLVLDQRKCYKSAFSAWKLNWILEKQVPNTLYLDPVSAKSNPSSKPN